MSADGMWREAPRAEVVADVAQVVTAKRAHGTPWSAEEVAMLHKHYKRRGPEWIARRVGRTSAAVMAKALTSGVSRYEWTAEEDATLCREWGEVSPRSLCAKLPGRSWQAITSRAKTLELPSPSRGMVSLQEAMRITGLERPRLLRVLAAADVRIMNRRRSSANRGESAASYRWRMVDPDEVREAVQQWLRHRDTTLTRAQAAAHCRVRETTIGSAMRALAATRPVAGYAPNARWEVSPADAEAAIALYRVRAAERAAYRRGAR